MTKDEANAVLKMDAGTLVNFDLVDSALLGNLRQQVQSHGDYTVTLADVKKAEVDAANKANADALAAKDAEHQAAVAKLATDHAAALAALQEQLDETEAECKASLARVEQLQVYDTAFQAEQKQRQRDALVKAKADALQAAAQHAAELAALDGIAVPVTDPIKFVEAGPPDDKLGKDGDTWTDTVSGNVYEKVNGTWF